MSRRSAESLRARLSEFNSDSSDAAITKSIDDTYQMLTVIDDKSASLLQFNGLLIAGNALLFDAGAIKQHTALEAGILGVIFFSVLTCLVCFLTVRISWPFLRV